jgi:hypothetical protein
MDRFLRFAVPATVVGGLLLATGAGLQAVVGGPMSVAAPTTGFAVAAALRLTGVIALLIGVTGLYLTASDRAGRLGLVGYTLTVANLVLQAGVMWADLFLSSTVAKVAPGILDGTVSDARMSAGFLATWVFNASFAVLGVALLRSHVYRRTVGWALVVMGLITAVPLPVDGPVYEVMIGLAATTAGLAARRPSTASQPASDQTARAGGNTWAAPQV